MRFLTALFLVSLCLPVQAEQVCSVHDGDTFKTCTGESIRVWGVDAPELKQPLGREARDYARRLLIGREVDLDCVGESWSRRVCRVMVRTPAGPLSLQRELTGWGYAYDSPKYSGGVYADAEAFARGQARGVWALPGGGVRPWDWRKFKTK